MNRNKMSEKIIRLEMNVNQLSREASGLKALAVKLVEGNVALQLGNDNLKRVLGNDEPATTDTANSKPAEAMEKPLPSKDNLVILYREGFRICEGELLGKHRHSEDCLFCLEVLSD